MALSPGRGDGEKGDRVLATARLVGIGAPKECPVTRSRRSFETIRRQCPWVATWQSPGSQAQGHSLFSRRLRIASPPSIALSADRIPPPLWRWPLLRWRPQRRRATRPWREGSKSTTKQAVIRHPLVAERCLNAYPALCSHEQNLSFMPVVVAVPRPHRVAKTYPLPRAQFQSV